MNTSPKIFNKNIDSNKIDTETFLPKEDVMPMMKKALTG